jgi:hypothetical protein
MAGVKALPHQATEGVRNGDQNGVDGARLHLGLELLESHEE